MALTDEHECVARKLSGDELAAVCERAQQSKSFKYFTDTDLFRASDDRANLLAHIGALEVELEAMKRVIENVYRQSNQPAVLMVVREYLNEHGGSQ